MQINDKYKEQNRFDFDNQVVKGDYFDILSLDGKLLSLRNDERRYKDSDIKLLVVNELDQGETLEQFVDNIAKSDLFKDT
jgi:hypothetical protein